AAQRAADAIDAVLAGRAAGPRRPWFFKSKLTEHESHDRYARAPAPRVADPRAEAARCLDCGCPALHDCRLRRYAARYDADAAAHGCAGRRELAMDRSHPDVDFEPGKCVLCGLCIAVSEQDGDAPGLALTGRGYPTRVGVPFADAVRAGIDRSALRCAQVCPSGAITRKTRSGP
ncbi:MAG TPA: hypothetical protein VL172_20895, partial [Kofleriaceae bacterium]|nr:hypothetical protein [Kofleriaceae bacterium]